MNKDSKQEKPKKSIALIVGRQLPMESDKRINGEIDK